jgi:hypothetical protein
MKIKKVSLFVFLVFFVSFRMSAQKTETPLLKGDPQVQERVSPSVKKDPVSNPGAPAVGVITSPVRNINAFSADCGYTISNGNLIRLLPVPYLRE